MLSPRHPGGRFPAAQWTAAAAVACLMAGAGCQAPAGRACGAAERPGPQAAAVLYPNHPAPGRVLALPAITGVAAQARPPGPVLRAVTGLTTQPEAPSLLLRPLSLAVRSGRILVCDTGRHALLEVDPATAAVRLVELHGLVGAADPVAVTTDAEGNAYVADVAGRRVLQVSPTDGVLRTYAPGTDVPFAPIDVAVSSDRLYAVNRAARRVEVFERDSARYVGPFGEPAPAGGFPVAVTLDPQGQVYVVDMAAGRVRVHDGSGQVLREIGRPGDRPGQFAQPRSAAVGPDGVLYVSDAVTQVVQVFNPAGEVLVYFGGADGSAGRMSMPAKVITDRTLLEVFAPRMPRGFQPKYMVFVADQVDPGRIGVYAFGQMAAEEAPQR